MIRGSDMFMWRRKNQSVLIIISILFSLASFASAEVKHKMYVPHPFSLEGGKSDVSIYNFDDKTLISTLYTLQGATLAKVTPDGKRIWIFSPQEKSAEIFDVATDHRVGYVYLDTPVCDVIFDPDGKTCYAANGSHNGNGENSVTFIDVERQVTSYTIATGDNPVSLAIQRDGSLLYVANQGGNSITVIDPKKFRVVTTLYAGIEPQDIMLSNAGQYLFVANCGVNCGKNGGSNITVIETGTGRIIRVIETGIGPRSLGLTPDGSRMVVLLNGKTHSENLWFYDMNYTGGGVAAYLVDKITFGKDTEFGTVDPSGKFFLIPDRSDTGVYLVDLLQSGSASKLPGLPNEKAFFVEFASIDIEKELATRDTIIANDPSSLEAQEAYFQKAYLYSTAGDRNAVVSTYNEITSNYPGTISEAKAFFKLGDLCYDQQLVANAASYYNRGLVSYAGYLETGSKEQLLPGNTFLSAAERLSELSVKLDTDHLTNLYKLYANVPVKLREFPQLFFSLGVTFKKQDKNKFARKCFDEVENRLIELMDETLYQEMRFKLDLVKSNDRARLSAAKINREIVLDGHLDEWRKAEELSLDRRDNVIVNQMRWLDRTDVSGIFYVGYDQYNLYVAGGVTDERVFRKSRNRGDYVAIHLDTRDGSGNYLTRKKEFGEGVFSIRVIPPTERGGKFRIESDQKMTPLVGGMITPDGYNFELKIPLAYLKGFSPKKGTRVGFGIEIIDIDSASAGDPPKVVGWLMPTRTVFGQRFSELFGILEF